MKWLRRLLSVALALSLALGAAAMDAPGPMADTPRVAIAMSHDVGLICEDCGPGEGMDRVMRMPGCQGGTCVSLPGLAPEISGTTPFTPAPFAAFPPLIAASLSPPPDPPHPRNSEERQAGKK